ncbi:hypothetical protein AYO21_02587 [Fonsecaea monophora]|uniref:CMP/dCMP-type deaminase domain-containing protein n=1 Tax=Fonsecaea monophora TaxID=254056 RepID=A0A177FHT6_9EURO|nr:hypothetical protein AYO21_02587 [Fonsecaea monophora]KAH0847198.1 cytidine and deoxycytidylate deaminase zinc-binding domain-containing protein [Fonsecaea pedrosoi]OAG43301.1 hypothetical protein AYO21_02587 [Fonsecaea monophora]
MSTNINTSNPAEPSLSTHLHYLRHALSLARRSPPKPTNFRVGCVIVAFDRKRGGAGEDEEKEREKGQVLATGYTLELEGNTHAEQNALAKLAREHGISLSLETPSETPSSLEYLAELGREVLTPEKNVYLYTTLEPCGKRLSGNIPCVQRIIATRTRTPPPPGSTGDSTSGGGIRKVIFGAREPGTFVQDSASLKILDAAGVPWEYVPGLEEEILRVAKEGHSNQVVQGGTNVDDISPEERRRQEALPRNPKKRMMEVDVSR